MTHRPSGSAGVALLLALLSLWGRVQAQRIQVPNGSFESPATLFAGVYIDSWEELPKREDYVETDQYTWDQLAGTFKNTPAGTFDHIVNCDGIQAAFLFAVREVGIFQDHLSKDWNDTAPTHGFDVRFEAGKSYRLTAGIIGGGGNMKEGVTLQLGVYYRDDADRKVLVSATTITNTPDLTPGRTNFVDFAVTTPTVESTDPWAGRNLGIEIRSTVTADLEGGYWDVDRVRLEVFPAPDLVLGYALEGDVLVVTWPTEADYAYQLEVSPDLQSWTPQGSSQTGTGKIHSERVPVTGSLPLLCRVIALPPL